LWLKTLSWLHFKENSLMVDKILQHLLSLQPCLPQLLLLPLLVHTRSSFLFPECINQNLHNAVPSAEQAFPFRKTQVCACMCVYM
jgi:hypothetical protein